MKEQQAIQLQEEAMRQAEQERLEKELKEREEKRKKEKEREEKRKNVSDRLEMIRKTEIGQKMLGNIELEVGFVEYLLIALPFCTNDIVAVEFSSYRKYILNYQRKLLDYCILLEIGL